MYARVTRFTGGDAESLREAAKQMNAADGPPPGVPSVGITMLIDAKTGDSLTIGLFETEEKLKQGDATLNEMTPQGNGGSRVSVEFYEVGVDRRL